MVAVSADTGISLSMFPSLICVFVVRVDIGQEPS